MHRDWADIFGAVCAISLVIITVLWLAGMLRAATRFAIENLL